MRFGAVPPWAVRRGQARLGHGIADIVPIRYSDGVSALKARVETGRLDLDEPIDLSPGAVVPLEIADDGDKLHDEERAALHDAIREGFEDAGAGRTIDAEQWAAELRARL